MSNEPQGKKIVSMTNPALLAGLREQYELRQQRWFDESVDRVGGMDAVDFLATIPDETLDLCFTDDPWAAAATYIKVKNRESPVMSTGWTWDSDVPAFASIPWVLEATRTLKPGGVLMNCGLSEFCTTFRDVCLDAGLTWRATVRVIVTNPRPQVRKANFRSSHWDIWIASKGKVNTFNWQTQNDMRNWIGVNSCPNCGSSVPVTLSNYSTIPQWFEEVSQIPEAWAEMGPLTNVRGKRHPCEKSVWTMGKYILIFTNPGDVVCDPFAGGGSIPLAAARLGRHYLANDYDLEWQEVAKTKLRFIQQQQ